MAIRYYYIDDDPEQTIVETARGLSVLPDILIVEPYQHTKWDAQIDFIIKQQGEFDGLLFDWSLNNKNSHGDEANYNIEALAQQLRGIVLEKTKLKKDFPIVLCSAQHKFKDLFKNETFGQSLFDHVYEKDDFDLNQIEIITQLADLAIGYQHLEKEKTPTSILNPGSLEDVDYRIVDYLTANAASPSHEISKFILSKLILIPGPLINEYILAARLGVDIIKKETEKDWIKLKNILIDCKYKGIFGNGWDRWWMSKIDMFWRSVTDIPLGDINAEARVKFLNDKFGLALTAAKSMDKALSSLFWTIDKKTNQPLAIEDGVTAQSNIDSPPWKEDEYYSIGSALEENILNIHPIEKDRLSKLKVKFTKTRS